MTFAVIFLLLSGLCSDQACDKFEEYFVRFNGSGNETRPFSWEQHINADGARSQWKCVLYNSEGRLMLEYENGKERYHNGATPSSVKRRLLFLQHASGPSSAI